MKKVNKKAISNIISTVLVVLLVFTLAVIIGVFINSKVRDTLGVGVVCTIAVNDLTFGGSFSDCIELESGDLSIQIVRGNEDVDYLGAKVSVLSEGNSYMFEINSSFPNNKEIFKLNVSELVDIDSVELYPIVLVGQNFRQCERSSVLKLNLCEFKQEQVDLGDSSEGGSGRGDSRVPEDTEDEESEEEPPCSFENVVCDAENNLIWQAGDSGDHLETSCNDDLSTGCLFWQLSPAYVRGENCSNRRSSITYPACEYCENLVLCDDGSFISSHGECSTAILEGFGKGKWRLPSRYVSGQDYFIYNGSFNDFFTEDNGFNSFKFHWGAESSVPDIVGFILNLDNPDISNQNRAYKYNSPPALPHVRARCVADLSQQ